MGLPQFIQFTESQQAAYDAALAWTLLKYSPDSRARSRVLRLFSMPNSKALAARPPNKLVLHVQCGVVHASVEFERVNMAWLSPCISERLLCNMDVVCMCHYPAPGKHDGLHQ